MSHECRSSSALKRTSVRSAHNPTSPLTHRMAPAPAPIPLAVTAVVASMPAWLLVCDSRSAESCGAA